MSEQAEKLTKRKELLKSLVKRLHQGEGAEKIKEQFKDAFRGVSAPEVARIEEELIKEGMPPEEIRKFCDVHIALFKESLDEAKPIAPAGHPIHILMEEHKILLGFANELKEVATKMRQSKGNTSGDERRMQQLERITTHLKESESHYLREENVLFPYLEKHGITQPPAMMWTEHDNIRKVKKSIYGILDSRGKTSLQDFSERLETAAVSLAEMLSSHFYKENNILFPTSLKVISQDEFREIRKQFDQIGYCCFTPESATVKIGEKDTMVEKSGVEGKMAFETGDLSTEQIEAMFNTLPVEITFIDREDRVRYFSQPKDKIFLRTKAVLGNKVQQCHPQKSIHLVNEILAGFKSGKRDSAEFWINLQGKIVYIRYFAVRNTKGEYIGCMEVTQDVTGIKKLEGEKRLL